MRSAAFRRAASVLAMVALATVTAATRPSLAARAEPPYRIVVGPWTKKKPPSPGTTLARTSIKGLDISIEYADARRRAEFLKTLGPNAADPFAPPPGRPERTLTFVVAFENRSAGGAVFQPGNVTIMTDRGDRAFPLDLTDLYLRAERAGVEDLQLVVDQATTILFDGSTTIHKGARAERLLAFRPLEGKWRQFQVHFSFLQVGTETHSASFTFSKEYLAD